jgi:hypothetical protein
MYTHTHMYVRVLAKMDKDMDKDILATSPLYTEWKTK